MSSLLLSKRLTAQLLSNSMGAHAALPRSLALPTLSSLSSRGFAGQSKAMEKKRAAKEAQEAAKNAPAVIPEEPQHPPPQYYNEPQPQQQLQQPGFFAFMRDNMIAGFGISLAFIIVATLFRSIGLEAVQEAGDLSPEQLAEFERVLRAAEEAEVTASCSSREDRSLLEMK